MKFYFKINFTKLLLLILLPLLFLGCSRQPNLQKVIASNSYAMNSYTKKGVFYRPLTVEKGETMLGLASWYGRDFHGKRATSGVRYNMYAYTVAHKTWPMGTLVRVKNLKTNRSVIARVTDRGPFVRGRVVDCSYAVAKRIGLVEDGVDPVRLTVVEPVI